MRNIWMIVRSALITKSLAYTSVIAVASPVAALVATQIADRFERKWQLAWAALAIAGFGLLLNGTASPWGAAASLEGRW
jgi:MFS transporter, putative metabolite:H+ symporter